MTSLLPRLAALGIHPKKSLGQNFLVGPAHRARIVAAADFTPADTMLEIGPGPGVLTEVIASQVGRVVAVGLDDRGLAGDPALIYDMAAEILWLIETLEGRG